MTILTVSLDSIVDGTFTNSEGNKLFTALSPYVSAGQVVRLSLRDATPMSSSFLNSSIGELIEQYGLAALRHSLKLTDYLPSHAAAIKQYIDAVASPPQFA